MDRLHIPTRRSRFALALLGLTVSSIAAWEFSITSPVNALYKGQPLITLLEAYHLGDIQCNSIEADRALSVLGTNAIPTLVWMLEQEDSSLKLKVLGILKKQHLLKVHNISSEERHFAARIAFARLKEKGEPGVPQLAKLCQHGRSRSARRYAAAALGEIGPGARGALPALLSATKDPDSDVRVQALLSVYHIHSEPQLVVPELKKLQDDPDTTVRWLVRMILNSFIDFARTNKS